MGKNTIDLKALLESKMGNIEPMKEAQSVIESVERTIPKNIMYSIESEEFIPETKPMSSGEARGLTVEEAKQFDDEMNRFIDTVLVAGVDYGTVGNFSKPTLLKPGAEKLMNYFSLICRCECKNRIEDYNTGFFSYEYYVYLIDYNGVIKGTGIGIANTREAKFAKQNPFSAQNVVAKIAKKRALVDGILNLSTLSSRFTQDLEDMSLEQEDNNIGKSVEELKIDNKTKTDRPATQKQISFLEKLMGQHGTSVESMNRYVKDTWNIEDYHKITGIMASQLIEKFKTLS